MFTAVLAYLLTLSLLFVVIPIGRRSSEKRKEDFEETFELFKLKTVRAHYPSLQELSYREIKEHYDVEQAYRDLYRRY